jgi:hypothetical protein
MFLPHAEFNTQQTPPNNVLVFDMFTVLENTFEQITIEYLLDVGHKLDDIKISTNNGSSVSSMSLSDAMVSISAILALGISLTLCFSSARSLS